MTDEHHDSTRKIVEFLSGIGMRVDTRQLFEGTFLPGISVENGTLYYDPLKLENPGDLLHEAGHLAILPPNERLHSDGDFANSAGNEMGAIAWSYAACLYIGLSLDVLFHENGYKGDASWLADTFKGGSFIGLPILEWKEMTSASGEKPYPEMCNWLCQ